MQRFLLSAAIMTIVLSASAEEGAKKSPGQDLPLIVSAGNPTDPSILTIECRATATVGQIECDITQASIRPPNPKDIAARLVELKADEKKPAELRKIVKANCPKSSLEWQRQRAHGAQVERDFGKRLEDACGKNDPQQVLEAIRWRITNVEAKTCKLFTPGPFKRVFRQVDADTWISVNTNLLCNATSTATLWRKKGGHAWSYKQLRSVPPNADKSCLSLLQTPVEWRWDAAHVRDLGCQYLEF